MLIKLILIFTIVPFIELSLLIELGTYIGTLNTIMVVVVTGIIGAFMARMAGLSVLFRIQENLRAGIFPKDEIFDGILILIGGAFLLTPGLLTDAVGFLLLLPLGRESVKRWLKEVVKKRLDRGEITFWKDGK
ncbi:MAG: FxsA family protein [Deltaproteobacteria bacterium]|nr:FxsA family protein [Deltaproteobacteria bacterium]